MIHIAAGYIVLYSRIKTLKYYLFYRIFIVLIVIIKNIDLPRK